MTKRSTRPIGTSHSSSSSATKKQKERVSLKTLSAPIQKALYTVVKRNGILVPFRKERINKAIESAFRDTRQLDKEETLSTEVRHTVDTITNNVVDTAFTQAAQADCLTVEGIQDIVEMKLMELGYHDVARDYVVYREQHKALREDSPRNIKVLRRAGANVRFNPMKITAVIEKAFRACLSVKGPTPQTIIDAVNYIADKVITGVVSLAKLNETIHIEAIQDEVEKQLMAEGYYDIAKHYILYRHTRALQRAKEEVTEEGKVVETTAVQAEQPKDVAKERDYSIATATGRTISVKESDLRKVIMHACKGLEESVSCDEILRTSLLNFYEGMKEAEVDISHIMAAKSLIEREPNYTYAAARLLLNKVYKEVLGVDAASKSLKKRHKEYFAEYIEKGIAVDRLDPRLREFKLDLLTDAMDLSRSDLFDYQGMQTLYDRYFIHHENIRLETPQIFWMRVAMGLSLLEGKGKEARAIEFYNTLSQFYYISATPTLFNAGTLHSQLSSCYLSTIMDDLNHIFKVVADDAQLSKWAGGIGNDWTNIRATGSRIKGTNGNSQGVIPFLKVANDTAVAVNQGGKRQGAMCAYLETWHLDIEDFIELRKNTGDERRRTHDMNTANWIPDLFFKRVLANEKWTLFSPSNTPDLHDLYGQAFEKRYCEYEAMVARGELKLFKTVEAMQLWRRMLSMLFETGHPWMTFKDPSNIRSPQTHVGVVHSSNLCTEILLNTSEDETAVCNLGSINLAKHTTSQGIDKEQLAYTIKTAIRMLDNVIDINFYPTKEAEQANAKHRPIGLGLMGFQDALYTQNISYASPDAVRFADQSMELISYHAILASSELAKERGPYSSYKGSKWEQGLLPIDTIDLLANERGRPIDMDRSASLDWTPVRKSIKTYGMRNSHTMAIAPTATIANITGITQSIEPMYKNLFVKSNLSGEFTIINKHLVQTLKQHNLWDDEMIDDLKYFDGSIAEIERIPNDLKRLFITAFEVEPEWIIECASRRQKWIDMGQSLNLYLAEPNGQVLHDMYLLAWEKGLKTTYYLRSLSATQVEKSSLDINKRSIQPRWMKNKSASSNIQIERKPTQPSVCNLEEGCESCQ
ncbi:ribonucleoside-diphosphate reductase subunit alpha [Simkania negevensis]|uniref:Ribonucleoside-diphosphate reductase n=1 Tax=Simkania negevensis TaxID=83561 RepID=A0ABS3ARR6_9BACT|nr:ribonucleoside-diphosphate reductase subunit alpha [Simkania negevensis]